TAGTGADHNRPITASTMGGTQIQCRSLLTGFWWLTPYSPSQSVTLRMRGTLPAARAPRNWRRPRASGGHQAAKLAERARLDLADALGGYAVLVGEQVQGGLVLGHPAPLHDVAAALIEAAQRAVQAIRGVVGALRLFHLAGGIGIRWGQVGGRAVGFLVLGVRRRIERQVTRREP